MGRLILIALFLGAIVAFGAILRSVWKDTASEGKRALRPVFGPTKDGVMAPTSLQKVSYVALIVVLLGTTTGWLGGL